MEGEYLDAIQQAGFVEVELDSTVDVFAGAAGETRADAFDTLGANIHAWKP